MRKRKKNDKKKKMNRVRYLWDINQWTNIHLVGVPEGEEREKGQSI